MITVTQHIYNVVATSTYNKDFDSCDQDEQQRVISIVEEEVNKGD